MSRIEAATSANTSRPVILTARQPSLELTCVGCSYPCHPLMQWSKKGSVQTNVMKVLSLSATGAYCVTSKLTVSYADDYTCHLCGSTDERVLVVNGTDNLTKRDSANTNCCVLAAEPMFVTDYSTAQLNRRVPESGSLVLDCDVTGRPSVTINWTRDGNPKPDWDGQAAANLSNAQISDSARYACIAENRHGMIVRQYVVVAFGKIIQSMYVCCVLTCVKCFPFVAVPKFTGYSNSQGNLPLDATADLFCAARGYPEQPQLVWSAWVLRTVNDYVSIDSAKSIRSVATVGKTGIYSCAISGTNEQRQQIMTVVARLAITFTTADGHLGVNGTKQLVCEARASPTQPTIT